jgi:hypothetical protein
MLFASGQMQAELDSVTCARIRVLARPLVAVPGADGVVILDCFPSGAFELSVHASIEVPTFTIILVRFPAMTSLEIGVASPGVVRVGIVPLNAYFCVTACLGRVDDAHLLAALFNAAEDNPRRMCESEICEASGEQADDEPGSYAKKLHVCHTDLLPMLRKNKRRPKREGRRLTPASLIPDHRIPVVGRRCGASPATATTTTAGAK